jgi:hypothetical protein
VPVVEVPTGVNVKKVAQAMVALPIWPDNIRTQLESVGDWEHTLLIRMRIPKRYVLTERPVFFSIMNPSGP